MLKKIPINKNTTDKIMKYDIKITFLKFMIFLFVN